MDTAAATTSIDPLADLDPPPTAPAVNTAPTGKTLTAMFPNPTHKYVQKIFDACVQHMQGNDPTFQFEYHTDEPLARVTAENIQKILNYEYSGGKYLYRIEAELVFPTTHLWVRIHLQ